MDTTLFIYESVYALAEGANSDHVVGKEATQLEFEDVYATDLTDTFIPYCMIQEMQWNLQLLLYSIGMESPL